MSKVATYLRGHIAGEVSVRKDVREAMSLDTGVLEMVPEMVIYPRHTNDIRKIMRFTWQLAEKGHSLSVTPRGAGTDATGAAIGKGIVLSMAAHMNRIYEYDEKQKLVRLQPGVTVSALAQALALHGADMMPLRGSLGYGTVGGAIASAVTGTHAGKYGTIDRAVDQLEVVLANGDVLQTGRLNKRDLSRKKGLQTMEGDVYRGIDAIIEEYGDVLDALQANDATGYNTIADVKQKDGSFDLTPLFIGSQGTLGVICEMIMRAEFRSLHHGVAALVFADGNAARDALDMLAGLQPAFLEYFDAELFDAAVAAGHSYSFYAAAYETMKPTAVVIVGFDDFNDHKNAKPLKRIAKQFGTTSGISVVTALGTEADELLGALDVAQYTLWPDHDKQAAPRLYSGFHVPTARLEEFMKALQVLADKEHIMLPVAGHVITNTYTAYPTLDLSKVADKQKALKLVDALTKLVYAHGGTMVAEGGEGRVKTHAVYAELDDRVLEMYEKIRTVCDPRGTLNPGVKQKNDLHALAAIMREHPHGGRMASFGL